MKKAIAAALLAAQLLTPASAYGSDRCFEDETCWDSKTMGNRTIGTIDPWERAAGPNLAGVDTGYVMVKWFNGNSVA